MSLFVKQRIKSSAVNNFSYNKLHKLTGLHINTCKRYVRILLNLGLARFDGNGNNTLVFCTLQSRHKNKNIDLKELVSDKISKIAYQLLAIFNVEIIQRKNWAKHIIATATNGFKHIKDAKRKVRKYGYGREFIDYGLSLNKIAQKLKCGLQKAQNIIKFGIKYGFIVKHKNVIQIYNKAAKYIFSLFPHQYTFATENNLYIIQANSYSLGSRYKDCEEVGW